MSQNNAPADPLAELGFEVERFEWTGDDRLEVVGRWFGVRGHRFVRPTLYARLGDRRRRLIALLDDKPWSPDAEGPWTASFAWRGEHDGISSVRLEVAPDVVLDLPAPGAAAPGTTLNPRPKPRRESSKPKPEAAAKPASPPPAKAPAVKPKAAPPAASKPPAAPDVATLALERRLSEERSAREGLVAELAEERAARERLVAELAAAQEQVAALAGHQASAVDRAQEVVRLEGELAAARQELAVREQEIAAAAPAEHLERELEAARDELAEARTPIEVLPLERRLPIRPRSDWGQGTRAGVVAALVVLFVGFALLILWVI